MSHRFEQIQLQWLDRVQAIRCDPIDKWIEGNVIEEAAPLGNDLVGRSRIGIIIEPPIPMCRGHFDDDIHLVENVLPVRDKTWSFRKITGHTHDGDVAWFLGPPGFHNFHGLQLFQQPLTPSADLFVQLSNRHDVAVQRGDLADHVHAARVLGFIRYRNQAGRIWFGSRGWRLAVDTFRLVEVDVLVAATIHRTPVEFLWKRSAAGRCSSIPVP